MSKCLRCDRTLDKNNVVPAQALPRACKGQDGVVVLDHTPDYDDQTTNSIMIWRNKWPGYPSGWIAVWPYFGVTITPPVISNIN